MASEIRAFENAKFGTIHALNMDGEPWFVAKDVCDALGLENSRKAAASLDEDEKNTVTISDGIPGNPNKTIISEAGFYKLVMKSRKPEAKAFQRWVTHEVLPAIRRTGGYMAAVESETPEQTMARALLIAQETMARKDAQIAEMKPKAFFADSVSNSESAILIGQLAKLICQNGTSIGQNRLFATLRKDGYLGKRGENYNLPTQRAVEMGLLRIKERTVSNPDGSTRITRTPMVTGKGQVYFIDKYSDRAMTLF